MWNWTDPTRPPTPLCRNKRQNSHTHTRTQPACVRTAVGHDIQLSMVSRADEKKLAKWCAHVVCSSIVIIRVVEAWLQCCTDCARWTAGRVSLGVMSRLLLVGLLFVSVPRSVLDVGRAGAQPVQVTTVLCIIDMILKEHLWGKIKKAGHWEHTRWFIVILSSGTGHKFIIYNVIVWNTCIGAFLPNFVWWWAILWSDSHSGSICQGFFCLFHVYHSISQEDLCSEKWRLSFQWIWIGFCKERLVHQSS